MTYKNIVTKRTWQDRQGNEKVKWLQVGTLRITDDNREFVELNIFPNTAFYIFEQKDRENEPSRNDTRSNEEVDLL